MLAESSTLISTLEALDKNCAARRRQIANLRDQRQRLEEHRRQHEDKEKASAARETALLSDPSLIAKEHAESQERCRKEVTELASAMVRKQAEARTYEDLVKQQKQYFIQSERILMHGGQDKISRHPTGDIALAMQPLRIAADEKLEVWDVGTAIANPYVVDSWPFEPNVLAARREITESPMQPFGEESQEDLRNEMLRLPVKCTGLPLREDEDEEDYEDEDDDVGPNATARSL